MRLQAQEAQRIGELIAMGSPLVDLAIKHGPLALKAGGAAANAAGAHLINQAEQTKRQAYEAHEGKRADAQDQVRKIQASIDELNAYRQRQWDTTIDRLTAWFEANERKLKKSDLVWDLEPIEITMDELPEIGFDLKKKLVVGGAKGIVGVGGKILIPKAIKSGVAKLGKAGNGRPIKQLRGAAHQRALLARLGGGPLAQGGGGMKAGARLLEKFGDGGTAAVVGIVHLAFGEAERQGAKRFTRKADKSMKQIDNDLATLAAVTYYCDELCAVFNRINSTALDALTDLESVDFDHEIHAEKFQMTIILMKALREVCDIPVVEAGTFTPSQRIKDYIENTDEDSSGTE